MKTALLQLAALAALLAPIGLGNETDAPYAAQPQEYARARSASATTSLSTPAFLLGLASGLAACIGVALYYHTHAPQQLNTMDDNRNAPGPEAGTGQKPAAPPPPANDLPAALQHPYPASIDITELPLDEQEEHIEQACRQNPDFAHYCELFRQGRDWRPQLHFMRDAAREYLRRKGAPTGEQSFYSELLQAGKDDHFWFAGDIHGSLDAFLRLYAHVLSHAHQEESACQRLILLGDILDRGTQSLETLAILLHILTHGHPRLKIMVIRGNHDAGIHPDGGRFDSIVSPAEFIEELDALLQSQDSEEQELGQLMGKAALRLAELSPVMAEITGLDPAHPERTLLCTHGGVPHTDLQAKLAKAEESKETSSGASTPYLDSLPDDLRESFALDYTWIRLVDKAPRKQPNRGNMGCQMGTKDVNAYRLQHWQRSGRAVSFIIRGHDHEQAGWALYSYDEQHNPARGKFVQRNCGVLTINSMDPDQSSCGLFTKRDVALAGCTPGSALTLTILEGLPPDEAELDENGHSPDTP